MTKKIIIYSLFILFLPCLAFGTDYYVTQSGAGNRSGSSLGNAMSVATFNSLSGDKTGDNFYFSGPFHDPNYCSSFWNCGCTGYTSDGYQAGDTAPLTDVWASSNGALLNDGMTLDGPDYVVIKDFRMTGNSATVFTAINSDHIIVERKLFI